MRRSRFLGNERHYLTAPGEHEPAASLVAAIVSAAAEGAPCCGRWLPGDAAPVVRHGRTRPGPVLSDLHFTRTRDTCYLTCSTSSGRATILGGLGDS